MNGKSLLMKNEIRTLSGYRALVISKYYFMLVLSLITIYLSIVRLAAVSLYILVPLAALPPIFKSIIRDILKKHENRFLSKILQDEPFQLNIRKTKYKYTRLNHVTEAAAYFVMILLLCLWQINYSLTMNLSPFLSKLPFLTLITGLTLRFLAVIVYHIKLPYDIMHNKM